MPATRRYTAVYPQEVFAHYQRFPAVEVLTVSRYFSPLSSAGGPVYGNGNDRELEAVSDAVGRSAPAQPTGGTVGEGRDESLPTERSGKRAAEPQVFRTVVGVPASISTPARVAAALAGICLALSACSSLDKVTAAEAPPSPAASAPAPTPSAGPSAPTEAEAAKVVEAYRAHVAAQVDELVGAAEDLIASIKRGSPERARERYPHARETWAAVRAIADRVDGLVAKVEAPWVVPDDISAADKMWTVQSEAAMWSPGDPAGEGAGAGGWQRIEWSIFADKTIKHLSAVGDELHAELETLRERVPTLDLSLDGMVDDAAKLFGTYARANVGGTGERWSNADLAALAGNVAGARAIVDALAPLVDLRAPGLIGEIRDAFSDLDAALDDLKAEDGTGYVAYDPQLSSAHRAAINMASSVLQTLSDCLERLGSAIS